MKLLFSEAKPDYGHYLFPYAIWAFPEPGESPGDLFNAGFLPSSPHLDRFYLCRQIRIQLDQFKFSSENRRIMRKGEGIRCELAARADFDYTRERRRFYKNYADVRFGKEVMTYQRLDLLFQSGMTSHLLLFTDHESGAEIGTVTLFLEEPAMAYYYYAFYDLDYYHRNLGIFMMTSAVDFFARRGVALLYLGSCYSRNALYKSQFAGAEFHNGFQWSGNLQELKYLIRRDEDVPKTHLLESDDFRAKFYPENLRSLAGQSLFQVKLPGFSP
jgi:arginyl-tRNA--protein-N-Asp/Glu arginylyltransferase